jgi:hypothetical protein
VRQNDDELLFFRNFFTRHRRRKFNFFLYVGFATPDEHDMSLQSLSYGIPLVIEPVAEKSQVKSPQKRPRVASIKENEVNIDQVLPAEIGSNPSTPSKTGKRNIYFLDSDTTDRSKNGKIYFY